ncbi:aspartate beta-hydroxylase [Natronospira proteinivora]|uniref:Aspartate beta-hydroxylase n=1 Tax=Natronospira proteinivora TaxID=1807133 RepID=A0ABT1GB57_9GAMM|nr:aspartyl/asparaginyl beta-hydroxylase domain-containing protein [Natronospira proteinivora]MCP1728556.1 aspartate beta-hydroxylase [Natronospira proteinivora]
MRLSLQQAASQMKQGQLGQARQILDAILAQAPDNIEALQLRSRLARQEGQADLAREMLTKAIARDPKRAVLHFDLGVLLLDQEQYREAIDCFEKADRVRPNVPHILLHLASALENAGEDYQAAVAYQRCWSLALQGGQGLKQLPPPLQEAAMGGKQKVVDIVRRTLEDRLRTIRGRYPDADPSRMERLIACLSGEATDDQPHPGQQPTQLFFPGLPDEPFLDRERPQWVKAIEAKTDVIREEFLALSEDNSLIKPYINFDSSSPTAEHWKDVNQSLAWGSCHLYKRGELVKEVAERCPETIAALEQTPMIKIPGHAPEIMFSVLKPHTRIPPHHGSVNGRLIVHLPLIVPENCGKLRVRGEARGWEVGRCMIFDDSYEHEAWNESDETRVVLIFDIWHPDVSEMEKEAFSEFNQVLSRMNRDIFGDESTP